MPMDCFPRDLMPVINILAHISLPWHRKTDNLNRRLFLSHLGWSHRNDLSEGHSREVLNLQQFSSLCSCWPWEEAGLGQAIRWCWRWSSTNNCWWSPGADAPLCCPRKPRSLSLLADSGEYDTVGNKINTWLLAGVSSLHHPCSPVLGSWAGWCRKTPKTYCFLWRKIFFFFSWATANNFSLYSTSFHERGIHIWRGSFTNLALLNPLWEMKIVAKWQKNWTASSFQEHTCSASDLWNRWINSHMHGGDPLASCPLSTVSGWVLRPVAETRRWNWLRAGHVRATGFACETPAGLSWTRSWFWRSRPHR